MLATTACTSEPTAEPQAGSSAEATQTTPTTAAAEEDPDQDPWEDLTNCPHFAFTLDDAERMDLLDEASERGLIDESSQDLMIAIRDSCLADESRPISEVVSSAESVGDTSVQADAADDGVADGGESGVCDVYFSSLAESYAGAGGGSSYEDLDPAELAPPWGFDVPSADCVARVTPGNGLYQYYLGWENTEFGTVLDALETGGMVVTQPWEDGDSRKYMLSLTDGTGLFWLDGGEGIYPDVAADDVLFVWGE